MEILILGGAGFLGKNLCDFYRGKATVTVVDTLDPLFRSTAPEGVKFIRGSFGDTKLMMEVVSGQDVIIHCAAQTSHPVSMQMPLFDADINVRENLSFLETLRAMEYKGVVIYISSSTVTGKAMVIDKTTRENPLDIYSANKLVAEKYYHIYANAYSLKTIVLRFPNMYGNYGKPYPEFGFINYFIGLAEQGKSITVYGDGRQLRNVLYVKDVVSAIDASLNKELGGETGMVGHKFNHSIIDIATIIAEKYGVVVEIVPFPESRKVIDVGDVYMDYGEFSKETGWFPEFSFREGLEDMR